MHLLERVGEGVVRLAHNLAAALLALATALVFFQVVTRFLLGDAAVWSEVTARGVIIWSTFLVAAAGFRLGAMIPIDFLREQLPAKGQIWVLRVVTLLTLVFLGVLIQQGWAMTERVSSQRIAMLGFSMSYFYAALPAGGLMAIPGVLLRHLQMEREAAGGGETS
ncbi:TRAP transporter small permease [Kushneria indalinina]|uniref:TRAP transporter small permease protein n=1 Tax=Kushneria indalinina DSM 14324 TaxID=1122140 RepID=A0A3D9DXP4_9GAMM|nr:TRAP transporter small permease [Kushneria indalinina]REC95064.1 TRAP-type C4-dicarboxylate transport system permease small subunit [Kushneria indalinina DSM 14324]